MMWLVVTVIVSIVAVELFFRLPVQISVIVLLDNLRSVTNVMRLQHASDHWKEKAMLGLFGSHRKGLGAACRVSCRHCRHLQRTNDACQSVFDFVGIGIRLCRIPHRRRCRDCVSDCIRIREEAACKIIITVLPPGCCTDLRSDRRQLPELLSRSTASLIEPSPHRKASTCSLPGLLELERLSCCACCWKQAVSAH